MHIAVTMIYFKPQENYNRIYAHTIFKQMIYSYHQYLMLIRGRSRISEGGGGVLIAGTDSSGGDTHGEIFVRMFTAVCVYEF